MRGPRGSGGYILLETIIAIMIITIAATGVLCVAVGASRARAPQSPDEDLMRAAESASETLSNYIADSTSTAYAPGGNWALPGDPCAFALQLGCAHDATAAFVSSEFRARWPNARILYTVSDQGGGALQLDMSVQQ